MLVVAEWAWRPTHGLHDRTLCHALEDGLGRAAEPPARDHCQPGLTGPSRRGPLVGGAPRRHLLHERRKGAAMNIKHRGRNLRRRVRQNTSRAPCVSTRPSRPASLAAPRARTWVRLDGQRPRRGGGGVRAPGHRVAVVGDGAVGLWRRRGQAARRPPAPTPAASERRKTWSTSARKTGIKPETPLPLRHRHERVGTEV
jgi:hypothetical protein